MHPSFADPMLPRSSHPNSHLLIVILDQSIAAWYIPSSQDPRRLPIEGQNRLQVASPRSLENALADLQSRLQSDEISDWMLHLVVDANGRTQISNAFHVMAYYFQQPWQLHDWVWLKIRINFPTGTELWLDENLIGARLLPWLTAQSDEEYHARLKNELVDTLNEHTRRHEKNLIIQKRKSSELQKNFDEQKRELEDQYKRKCDSLRKKAVRLQTKITALEEQHALDVDKLKKKLKHCQQAKKDLGKQAAAKASRKATKRK